MLIKIRKCSTKKLIKDSEKFLEFYEKQINDFYLLQFFLLTIAKIAKW